MEYQEIEGFIDFLDKNKIFDKYLSNLKNNNYFNIHIHNLNEAINSFVWDRTPEGYNFWKNIDFIWRENCDSFPITIEELIKVLQSGKYIDLGD